MPDDAVRDRYLPALLAGDARACEAIVQGLLREGTPALDLYTGLFRPSLYRVGELWEANRISVATEHLATAITERLLALAYPALLAEARPAGRRAVVSCGVNEFHQIGARMVADLLESRGFDVAFLGASTPAESLLSLVDERKPEFVALSVSIFFNLAPLDRLLAALGAEFPRLPVIVGGQAFRHGGCEILARHPAARLVASLEELTAEFPPPSPPPPCAPSSPPR